MTIADSLQVIVDDESISDMYRGWAGEYLAQSLLVKKADEEEPVKEDFLAEELAIAAAMGAVVAKKSKEHRAAILDELKRDDLDRASDAILAAAGQMDEVFDENTEDLVRKSLDREMIKGAAMAEAVPTFRGVSLRDDVLDGMVKASKYYTNNYFNTFVVPSLQDAIQKQYITGNGGEEAFRSIQDLLNKRLKTVPYWRVVANAAASRSYHYGLLKSGALTGNRGYVLRNPNDEKTSKVCKNLSGREFWIADAVAMVERSALVDDATEVKELQPWLKYNDMKDLTNDELVNRGVMVPPFHGNCRTTLELISGF